MQTRINKKIESPLPVNELLDRADRGDAECQYWAGIRYLQADGVTEDLEKAYRYCSAAAEQGHPRAQAFLGYCLSKGIAVPQQPRLSVQWYRRSAKQGYAPAQYSLGLYYLQGRGVKKNIRQAIHWLDLAARQGDPDAQLRLGQIYHQGAETVQDDGRAYPYFLAAAEQGVAEAQYLVATLLGQGSGVDADQIEAFYWLDRAAVQEYGPAVETRERFDAFTLFEPAEAELGPIPLDHAVPLRHRTIVVMQFLGRPCLQQMAKDIHDFVTLHPKNAAVGYRDIAALLAVANRDGEALLPFAGDTQLLSPAELDVDEGGLDLFWVVKHYPCEWDGQKFPVAIWAVITKEEREQGEDATRMDTLVSWGRDYIRQLQTSGEGIDAGRLEREANEVRQKYESNPVPFSPAEMVLAKETFQLLDGVLSGTTDYKKYRITLNVVTATRWGVPACPEPSVAIAHGRPRENASRGLTPDIGFARLKDGDVRVITVGPVPGTDLVQVVTLEDYEPEGHPVDSFLWRYSLLHIPAAAFRPDRRTFKWELLWLKTHFFWTASLVERQGTARSMVAVWQSQSLSEGHGADVTATEHPLPEALESTDDAVLEHVRHWQANPLPFTPEEMDLLHGILSLDDDFTINDARLILAAYRWGRLANENFKEFFPELQLKGKVQRVSQGGGLQFPAKGLINVSSGPIPSLAVDRNPNSGRLLVVSIEDSSQVQHRNQAIQIPALSLFEIEDCLFIAGLEDTACAGNA
ncbi:MAG: sel1 repeat family protein [Deltaproteobacteria bacterium]|nr:MAG: sel1 repeat family protein [Deltaproteobacteria bacterium]